MVFVFDDFELDAERLELRRSGKLLKADRTVLLTLACLAKNAGQLVTKDELVDEVWGGRPVADTVITVATARLRKTLGQRKGGDIEFIENVYGRGYRFVRTVVTSEVSSKRPPAIVDADAASAPFVGRARVLHRLRQALGEARRGHGRLCALMGEPGIGKTHVVEAFVRELQGSEVTTSWGFCHELGVTAPLSPWQRALRPVLGLLDPAELDASLGAFAGRVRGLFEGTNEGAPPALAPEIRDSSRYRLFDAISRAVALAAEKAPLVIIIDDLHRADVASLELLGQLVDELARTRLLVVATLRHASAAGAARPEPSLSYALGHRNCERIMLEPLSEAEVAQYVGAVLEDADGALGRAVFDKSEGNPFFMVELSRQLSDMESPAAGALAVPEAAFELIRQRLAQLDEQSRRVLSAAAVVGRSFDLALLQSVTGSEPAALMASLDEALGAEVVIAAPDSVTDFAFGHELLRTALYEGLSPSERRRGHLATALALEQRRTVGESVPASELAFHFHRALPEGDPRKTVEYCRKAAAASSLVFANAEFVRYTRHALQALDLMPQPSVRLRLALLQGISMHTRTTDPAEFSRATREIVRLAREHGDGPNLVGAGAMLNPSMGLPPEQGAREAFEGALAVLPPDADGLRALALAGVACTAPDCYDREITEPLMEQARARASAVRSPTVEHGVLLCQLYLHGGPAHDDEERGTRRKLEELYQSYPRWMPVLPAELAFSRAVTALQRAEHAAAADALDRAVARCREIDQREGLWHAERALVLLRFNAGADAELVSALTALHQRAEQQSLSRTAAFSAFDRAVVLPELGHPPVLDETLRRALTHSSSDPPSVWSLKIRALAAAGWVEAAHASLRAVAPGDLERLPCDRDHLGTLGHLARVALALGAHDYAEAVHTLLARYPERFASHVSFLAEGSVPHLLGMLEMAFGRHAEAITHLQAGIALDERAGLARCAEEARALLAQCR